MPRRRLSALIVNYNSGAFARACVATLQRDWQRSGRRESDLEIVLVDNASPVDQSAHLAEVARQGATVVRSERNSGYAGGINLALRHSSGGPEDVVAILNPDLCFLPGSVDALMGYLHEHPRCGAVDPRTWVDLSRVLNLPRNVVPSPADQLWQVGAMMSPTLCRSYSRARLRGALEWWTAREPIESDMLSGCCLFLRRAVVEKLGVLMDERYPLYFEDTDLFARLSERGYTLVHHIGAHVVHHWSRSAGVGGQFHGEPFERFKVAQREYFAKYHGRTGLALVELSHRLAERWPRRLWSRPMHELRSLGALSEPVALELPRECSFLLEFGMAPTWILAVGVLGRGRRWVCPRETWSWFFAADYFVRAIDVDTREVLGAWNFQKSIPGRETPLTPDEIEAVSPLAAGQRSAREVV